MRPDVRVSQKNEIRFRRAAVARFRIARFVFVPGSSLQENAEQNAQTKCHAANRPVVENSP